MKNIALIFLVWYSLMATLAAVTFYDISKHQAKALVQATQSLEADKVSMESLMEADHKLKQEDDKVMATVTEATQLLEVCNLKLDQKDTQICSFGARRYR